MQALATSASRIRLGAGALAVAGILFVLYPAIRPFSDEISLQGAAAFARDAWVVAHTLAIVGFILLTLGLLSLAIALQDTPVGNLAFWALVVGLIGVGLTLTFYGIEAFAVHDIGQRAVWQHDVTLMRLAAAVRTGPQLIIFTMGLLLVAVSTILAAIAVWRSRVFTKWSGVPMALGFALFIPQFFGNQPIRIVHGLLITAGCLWLATGLWQRARA